MKLQNLISISQNSWIDGFQVRLDQSGASKKSEVFRSLTKGQEEEEILIQVYGTASDKTKRTFNQTTSSLYKELLTHLLFYHREYSDLMMANLRALLAEAEEEEFLRQADVVERVFIDCEAFEHQITFYHLLQDHHFQNKYKAAVYQEYTSKLRMALDHASDHASIEEYFLREDLWQKGKRGEWKKEKIDRHRGFFEAFFSSDHPYKTQIRARHFWLKTLINNDYLSLSSEDSQSLSKEMHSIMSKRPYLYFNLPEIAEFTDLYFTFHTSYNVVEPEEVNQLVDSFLEKINDENLIKLYPRVVQGLITSQARYYGARAGFRFIDDPEPMDPIIEKGLRGLLPMVKKIRNRPNLIKKGERLYGLETEALCRMHLPDESRFEAARLFELQRVQEQQLQHVMGAHMIHTNLMQCYFFSKQWPELIEEIEKYKRFIKAKGELNPLITRILSFNELIGKLMLKEIEMSPSEIERRSKEIFEDHPKWYKDMAVYSMDHLKLR